MEFTVELPPPTFEKGVTYAPPVSVFSTENVGFKIKDLLENDPGRYAWGKIVETAKKASQLDLVVLKSAVQDADKFKNPGVVLFGFKAENQGRFQYKCGSDELRDLQITDNQFLVLTTECMVKFVPSKDESNWNADTDNNWKDGAVSFKGHVCSDLAALKTGVQAVDLSTMTSSCGQKSAEVRILRAGCGGKLGGKIEKKCDGSLCSSAELRKFFISFLLANKCFAMVITYMS